MTRCRDILVELLAGIQPDGSELVERVQAIYDYLLRSAVVAQQSQDQEMVSDVISVLEEERTTWQLVCEQLPEAVAVPPSHIPREVLAPKGEAILPQGYGRHGIPSLPARGATSFEA